MPTVQPSKEPPCRPDATLLVFTLDAARERARRKLLPGRLRSWELALYQGCLDAALEAGRANGCVLRVCAPRRLDLPGDVEQFIQSGQGFGERLRRAISDQRPAGGRPLVVVGSDAPGLAPGHVADALGRLAARPDRLVVGPSPDGGFYLLAAARPVEELLASIRWRSRETLAGLLAAARARGIAVALLAPLADLDCAADLESWLTRRSAPAAAWRRQLAALLRRLRRPRRPAILGRPDLALTIAVPARGPPG